MPNYIISLDIGATKTAGALMLNNKIIKKIKRPTNSKGTKIEIINGIQKTINLLWVNNVKKISIALAGQIDEKKGVVNSTANFNPLFKQIDLEKILGDKFKIKTSIENDVKCFALGEINFGEGKHIKNFLTITFGTGIGGAIVIDKKLYRGQDNLAGEFGHMKISGSWLGAPPVCGCKQKYCWESVASGSAWNKITKKHGEKIADKIISENIATGLANLSAIFNPEAIIMAGGLIEHKNIFGKIRKEFNIRVFNSTLRKTRLIKSKLGEDAILLGATV
jgi:predicted NBD/HSP70 family sugar kinase